MSLILTSQNKHHALVTYLSHFIGWDYVWGGNGAQVDGWDCSGLVQEGLASIGLWGKQDTTAAGLYKHFASNSRKVIRADVDTGHLLFFGEHLTKITHVAVAANKYQMIEAGGGSQTVKGGMVRLRPIVWRSDFLAALDVIKN